MMFKIFGGSGFIGSHLVKKLLSEGHKVTVFDIKKPRIVGANVYRPDSGEASWYNPVNFIGGDITDFQAVYYAVDRGDYVINLAAISQAEECDKNLSSLIKTNVSGAVNVLHACKLNNAAHYTFMSSGAVYSPYCTSPVTEDKLVAPISNYALSKWIAEESLNHFSEKFPVCILRLPHVYGPGKSWGINSIITTLLTGERPIIYGDGAGKIDLTYVTDIVQAIKIVTAKNVSGIYNVGSDTTRSIEDFFKLAKIYLDYLNTNPLYRAPRKYDYIDMQHDITKLKELGYKPEFDLENGLQKTVLEWQQWL